MSAPAVTAVTPVTAVPGVAGVTAVTENGPPRASPPTMAGGVPTRSISYCRYFGNRSNLHTPGNRLVGRAARPWPRWPTLVVDPKFHP